MLAKIPDGKRRILHHIVQGSDRGGLVVATTKRHHLQDVQDVRRTGSIDMTGMDLYAEAQGSVELMFGSFQAQASCI